ncbi:OST-HTH/LOTUS domain-containing protein [Massilia timonae]|uniref:OST-HTH/LOTUS domain-containing protein n=1 Tax=Massilia timonae TaxID=47229 RepID=UPI00115FA4F3|nr:OST-HTH/LOTUS domain-containing protein [Massilia timonae]
MKRILPYAVVSGEPEGLSASLAATSSSLQNSMLGNLVGALTKTFLTTETVDDKDLDVQADIGDTAWVTLRTQVVLDAQRYQEAKAALKELVTLRNELIHHFIEQHDLKSDEGSKKAEAYLEHSYIRIEGHLLMLRAWTSALVHAHTVMASVVQDSVFEDLIDGIAPDGSIAWTRSGIVQALREAEELLAVRGWTPLSNAIAWIGHAAPTHFPKRYHCSSWRQVLHESKQFEVRRDMPAEQGSGVNQATAVWYRSRRTS